MRWVWDGSDCGGPFEPYDSSHKMKARVRPSDCSQNLAEDVEGPPRGLGLFLGPILHTLNWKGPEYPCFATGGILVQIIMVRPAYLNPALSAEAA